MKQKYTKKIIKYFDSLYEGTILKLFNKTNIIFNKTIKNFVFYFQKRFFKLRNIIDNILKKKSRISNFNKLLITSISILFFYLFYLSIPTLYDKTWLQNNIETKLFDEFKINFSISPEISYNILPSPHFLIKNSKIFRLENQKPISLSEIKNLKVFISQKNLFNKNKIFIKKIGINKANFLLKKEDLIYLNKASNNKFSHKKIKVNNSNIFLKDSSDEVITIIKISRALLSHDNLKFSNFLRLKGETFKIPFVFDFEKKIYTSENKKINIEAKKLKLNILNKSSKDTNNLITGSNTISIVNSNINTQYNINKDLITFQSINSRLKNSNLFYKGTLSFTPFDLKMNIDLENFKLSKLITNDSIFTELIKNRLLLNENISAKISFIVNSTFNKQFFNSAKINLNALNGQINIDQSEFINDKIGTIKLDNSSFFFEKEKLVLNSNININIKDSKILFSFLKTPKSSRKQIKNIFINLDYNFSSNKTYLNTVKIDGVEASNEILRILENLSETNNNLNLSRRLINKMLSIYAG
jgi:hypothetical protein